MWERVLGTMKRPRRDALRSPGIRWSDLIEPIGMICHLFLVINICVLVMQPMPTEARDLWVEALLTAGGAASLKSLSASIIGKFSYVMSEQGFKGLDFSGTLYSRQEYALSCVFLDFAIMFVFLCILLQT
jgi:hypothetical protein